MRFHSVMQHRLPCKVINSRRGEEKENMRLRYVQAVAGFFLAAILSVPAWGDTNTSANAALPGTLNYVEGEASIGSNSLDSKSIGSAELQAGQSLTTGKGKAEVLLTPGVFLRVGNDSSVK